MKYATPFILGLSVLALLVPPVQAGEPARTHLAVYAGAFDVLDDNTTAQLGVEYRGEDVFYGLRPSVGVNVDEDSALYGYAGLNWDLNIAPSLYLTPNFMVGAYSSGAGKDLGGALEFRSGIEASYAFENDSRLGVAFNHISNASLYDANPGAEALLLVYQHPLAW